MGERSLKNCIVESLGRFARNVLLEDDYSTWTGERLLPYLQFLTGRIEKETLPSGRVGICFPNGAPQAIAILATILSGRVPVVINNVDLVSGKFDWVKSSKLSFLIIAEELAEAARVPHLILNKEGLSISLTGKTTLEAQLDQVLFVPPPGTALVLFTSGSTGEPKEVYVPEQGLLRVIDDLIQKFNLTSETVASIALPICHSMAMNTQFLPTLLVGGKCRFHNLRLSINRIYRDIHKDEATFIALIGEVIRSCWDEKRIKKIAPCVSVSHVQLAGGMITPRHLDMARDLFPRAKIFKGYGLTEAIRVTMIDSEDPQFLSSAVGRPLDFIELEIRDENQVVLPASQFGEIYVRGASLLLGSRRLNSPHVQIHDSQQFLPTGDLGQLDEKGYLHVNGRLDSLFKINGRRISGAEVEKTALEVCEHFRFAKALLVSDNEKDRPQIILFLELAGAHWKKDQPDLDAETFAALVENLKSLPVPPREVIFTSMLPRTSNGKLNLADLYEIWKERSIRLRERENLKNLKMSTLLEGL